MITYHPGFDIFHNNSDPIYRFVTEQRHPDAVGYAAAPPPASGAVFRDDYTFGEKAARTCEAGDVVISLTSKGEEKKLRRMFITGIDSDFRRRYGYSWICDDDGGADKSG